MELDRQSSKTLAKWWHDLNGWRWPKAIPLPESPDVPHHPRRSDMMRRIEHVLAFRFIRQLDQH